MLPRARFVTLALALFCFAMLPQAFAGDAPSHKVVKAPAKGSVYHAIIEGLKLIDTEHFGAWVRDYCSPTKLCITDKATGSLKRYNLPAMKRMAPFCLKGQQDELHITRTDGDPKKDKKVKIFILCKEGGMPRPFRMIKEDGGWRFEKI
jgi:hypothetical protein